MPVKKFDNLLVEALAIEAEEAKKAGALGFMARALVQATMPHRDPKKNEFTRTNGDFTLSILSPSAVGLPFGSIPRLLMAWVTTEAVKTKSRELMLGRSLREFMEKLDISATGGKKGSIPRLKNQMQRLFSSSISCIYDGKEQWAVQSINVVDMANLWWSPKDPSQETLFESTLLLSETFFKEVVNNPVPLDMRAIRALSQSPMALDIYSWLTYRMSYLDKETTINWASLEAQFGADYTRARDFRKKFIQQTQAVLMVYPEAKIKPTENGLILKPSNTHIPKSIR